MPVQVPVHVPVQVTYAQTAPIKYQGPYAPLGHDGRVIDTPEVAQARADHLQAYARAAALTTHQSHAAPAEAQLYAPAPAPTEAQVYAPPPTEAHVYAPPPTEAQARAPAEAQYRAPEAQFHGSAEAQVHEPSAEGEHSYEEGYY